MQENSQNCFLGNLAFLSKEIKPVLVGSELRHLDLTLHCSCVTPSLAKVLAFPLYLQIQMPREASNKKPGLQTQL